MLSNNVPITFSVEESDFFLVSGQSGLSSNEKPCYLIKRLFYSIYKNISRANVY